MPSVKFLLDHPRFRKSGWLYKQGGSYRSVKKRFAVLMANELFYFSKEDDEEHKGSIVLRGPVNRSSLSVEVKSLNLRNCIEIPSDKRTYLIWTDSEYLAGEWADALNGAYKEFSLGQSNSSPSNNQQQQHDELSDGGDDYSEDNTPYDESNVKITSKQLIEKSIDKKDKFDNTNFIFENNCCIHPSLVSNIHIVEPLQTLNSSNASISSISKYLVTKKRQFGNKLTLENALSLARTGDSIVLKPGKHYIPSTLIVNQSIYLIGESDKQNKCEVIILQDSSTTSQYLPCACFNAPFSYCKNIDFIHFSNLNVNNNLNNSTDTTTTTVTQSNIAKGRIEATDSILSPNVCQFLTGQTIMVDCTFQVMSVKDDISNIDPNSLFDCCWVTGSKTCVQFRKCNFMGGKNGLVGSINSSIIVENNCQFKEQLNHSISLSQQSKLECKNNNSIYGNICLLHQSSAEISGSHIYSQSITILDDSILNMHHNTLYLQNLKFITFNHQQQTQKNKLVHNTFKIESTSNIDPCKISMLNNSCPIIDDNQFETKCNDLSLIYIFQNKNNMKNMLVNTTSSNTSILVVSDYLN